MTTTKDVEQLSTPEQREALMNAQRKGRKTVARKAKQLNHLAIEYVSVHDIKPNAYNPNRQNEHDFELLLRSMEEDGFTQPVVAIKVDEETRQDATFAAYAVGDIVIVDGEHRWRAAQRLGYDEIPVVITDMTPEQMRISTLRHNRARGSEDIELTAAVLRDLESLGAKDWALDSLMMSEMELERLIEDVPAPEALADEEYNEAWAPDKGGSDIAPVEGRESVQDSGGWMNASTGEAIQKQREKEEKLKEAKTEEQRTMIARDIDKDFYRVSLLLYGEDATVVKEALKGAPAEALAAICRDKLKIEKEPEDGTWVTLDSIVGRRTIPAEAAKVIRQALSVARVQGDITDKNGWQLLELLAADYIAGLSGEEGAGDVQEA